MILLMNTYLWKASERMPIKKLWDHVIEVKEEFVQRNKKVYLLLREERGEEKEKVCKFIEEQLRKEYISTSNLLQIALVFL